jgi:hypothetical protein
MRLLASNQAVMSDRSYKTRVPTLTYFGPVPRIRHFDKVDGESPNSFAAAIVEINCWLVSSIVIPHVPASMLMRAQE